MIFVENHVNNKNNEINENNENELTENNITKDISICNSNNKESQWCPGCDCDT